jgi:hypothetical protein
VVTGQSDGVERRLLGFISPTFVLLTAFQVKDFYFLIVYDYLLVIQLWDKLTHSFTSPRATA